MVKNVVRVEHSEVVQGDHVIIKFANFTFTHGLIERIIGIDGKPMAAYFTDGTVLALNMAKGFWRIDYE